MKSRLIKLMLRIERAFHLADAYLAGQRGDFQHYKDARIKASQAEFKFKWGV